MNSQAQLENRKVDHLILLVGGNPLPNAVAGRLLVKDGGKVTLVHSAETAKTAQRIDTWLNSDIKYKVAYKEIEESNPTNIVLALEGILKTQTGKVGLHYTGGTKIMSVHAHRVARAYKGGCVLSYLDARTLELVIDADSPETGQKSERGYVGRHHKVNLKIDDLLELHGLSVKKIDRSVSMPTLVPLLGTKYDVWQTWQQTEITANCRREDDERKWKTSSQLETVQINWPRDAELSQALKTDLDQTGEYLTLPSTRKKRESLLKWLEGGYWLDEYTFDILNKQVKAVCSLNDLATSIESQFGIGNDDNFEIDVIAMRGYQCFAISCTTDTSKKLCKSKLLEAYIRAKQLGGDEARVALICFHPNPEQIEKEIDFWDSNIRVFGRDDLPTLGEQLHAWIEDACQEKKALCSWL